MRSSVLSGLLLGATGALCGGYPKVDFENKDEIIAVAKTLAYDLVSFYDGNETGRIPGILPGPPPYYWWEGGAMWGCLIEYWLYTGNDEYNEIIKQGIEHQKGPNNAFMPTNWTASLGNDDQGFWGITAITAAEAKFPNPPPDHAQWLALAQGVFNTQAAPDRHDDTCGGGLRWQIPSYNIGYDYKNSIANGCFFNIAARLARYTGNTTFSDWAHKTYDWETSIGLIDDGWHVYDGAHIPKNCTDINKIQYSYNVGVWLQGAAYMYNHTNGTEEKWEKAVNGLLDRMLETFFPDGIATEYTCQNDEVNVCTTDALTFKNFDCRWMAVVAQICPWTSEKILPALRKSAAGALAQCVGGENGRMCGYGWGDGGYDGTIGAGQQMSALGAVISTLYPFMEGKASPVTNETGGNSTGNPDGGSGGNDVYTAHTAPVTTGSKAGAGVLTAIVLILGAGAFFWMSSSFFEGSFSG